MEKELPLPLIVQETGRSGCAIGMGPIPCSSFPSVAVILGRPTGLQTAGKFAFRASPEGNADIYVIRAEGGLPRRLTTEASVDAEPSWSRDGRWIYFNSNRSGTDQVWKMPAEGGPAVQVTKKGGVGAVESPGGKFVYYAEYSSSPRLRKVPVEGGEESLVHQDLKVHNRRNWAVADDGIYFIDPEGKTIKFFSFAHPPGDRVHSASERSILARRPRCIPGRAMDSLQPGRPKDHRHHAGGKFPLKWGLPGMRFLLTPLQRPRLTLSAPTQDSPAPHDFPGLIGGLP